MTCPYCRRDDVRVVDSRDADGGTAVRRRRECGSCGRRFTTFERVEEAVLVVVKRDGSREPFDRAKVMSGITKACKNLTVADADMLRVTDEVEELVRQSGEVTTEQIGRRLLSRLKTLDPVAYVRFASVYKGFTDVGEFGRVIEELEKSSPPKKRVTGQR